MDSFILEIIGYIASILVAISLMMSSILRLRIINLVGALVFTIYGLLIKAYPVAAVNFFIVLIDLYFLFELTKTREYFKFLSMRPNANYLQYFLNFHQKDIQNFLPDYKFNPQDDQMIFFVLRNMVPAGLFIGEIDENKTLQVKLDFVIPGYRDLKVGRYLYQQKEFFQNIGVERFISTAGSVKHERYLKRMGFTPIDQGESKQFELAL